MKDHAPVALDTADAKEALLETVVSAHYLALQMRILASMPDFPGAAETELIAEALNRWARLAGARWRDDSLAPLPALQWSESGRDVVKTAKRVAVAKTARATKLRTAHR